jgi:glutaminyl-tRNA synthetase
LDFCVREDLNKSAARVMAVLDPLKIVITNYPAGQTEELSIENNPEDTESGSRIVPFSNTLYIERDDFMEEPMKKFFRLGPGLMVRLKGAYIIQCDDFVKDELGNITELHCSYFPESRSGSDTSGINVKGVIHWVSVPHAVKVEARLYDRLLILEDASQVGDDFKKFINPDSLTILPEIFVEPSLKEAKIGTNYQFMRKGYFCLDTDSTAEHLVFNRTVGLKDSFKK